MATATQRPELLVIVGPTASGKSDLALKVAQRFNGEIVAADSRTIYIGMDIGTAKPTKEEQELVPNWGLDLVEPGHSFSAYQFKKYAEAKIQDIQRRGKLPILVGGTGLYIDSVVFDFDFIAGSDPAKREELEQISTEQLQNIIQAKNYPKPENIRNRRHLIRTIEREGRTGGNSSVKDNALQIGILPEPQILQKRIDQRAQKYFDNGLLKETQKLLNRYGEEALLKTGGIAYMASFKVLNGELNTAQAVELIQKQEWQYARRQRTWFKRNKFIRWFDSADAAYKEIASILNN